MGGFVICRKIGHKKIAHDSFLFERVPYEKTPFKRKHIFRLKPVNASENEPVYLDLRNTNNNFVWHDSNYSESMSINVGLMSYDQKKSNQYLRNPRTFTYILNKNNRFPFKPTLTLQPADEDKLSHIINDSSNMNCVRRSDDCTHQCNGCQNRPGSQKKKPRPKICPKLFPESRALTKFKKSPCCGIVHQSLWKGENEDDSQAHFQQSPRWMGENEDESQAHFQQSTRWNGDNEDESKVHFQQSTRARVKFSDKPRTPRGSAFLIRNKFDDSERSGRQSKTERLPSNGASTSRPGSSRLRVQGSFQPRAYIITNNVRQKSPRDESVRPMSERVSPLFHRAKQSRIIQARSLFGSVRVVKQTQSPQDHVVDRTIKRIQSSQAPSVSRVKTMPYSHTQPTSATDKRIPYSHTPFVPRSFKQISSSKTRPVSRTVDRIQSHQDPYMNSKNTYSPFDHKLTLFPDGKQSPLSKFPRGNLRTKSNSPDIMKYTSKTKSSRRYSDIRPDRELYTLDGDWHHETRSVPAIPVEKDGEKLLIVRWHSLPTNSTSAASRSVSPKGVATFGNNTLSTHKAYNKTAKTVAPQVLNSPIKGKNIKITKRDNFLNNLTQDYRKDIHFIQEVNVPLIKQHGRSNVARNYAKRPQRHAINRISAFNTTSTKSPPKFKTNNDRMENKPNIPNKKVKVEKSAGSGRNTKVDDGSDTINNGKEFDTSSRSTSQDPITLSRSSSVTMGDKKSSRPDNYSSQTSLKGSYRDYHSKSATSLTTTTPSVIDSLQSSTKDTSSKADQTSINSKCKSLPNPSSDQQTSSSSMSPDTTTHRTTKTSTRESEESPSSHSSSYPETQSNTDSRTSQDVQSSDLFDYSPDSDSREMSRSDKTNTDSSSKKSPLSSTQSEKRDESEKESGRENSRTKDSSSKKSPTNSTQSEKRDKSEKESSGKTSKNASDFLRKSTGTQSSEESESEGVLYPGLSKSSLTSLYHAFPLLEMQIPAPRHQSEATESSESSSSVGGDDSWIRKNSSSVHTTGDLFLDTWYDAPYARKQIMKRWNRDREEKRHRPIAKAWKQLG